MIDIKQLEYFMNVAELGGFLCAAAYLSVPRAALGRQVQNLEYELNTHLLYRTGRGVMVTESGHQLVSSCKWLGANRQRERAPARALSA
ncbi:MAG: LysR family transcriptional regulator [Alphaproteobacteria bacterium]|nr:LysR family transcriptional regulator [Alphaproteobacteria bacterium]